MKIKNFVLTTAISLFCLLGCACGAQSKDSDSSSPEEPVYQETTTIISLNQDSVTFCVGENFTLIASSTVEGAEFTWSIDGEAAQDVLSIAQTGNTAVITALNVGETKLVASMEQDGCVYFRTVEVTVVAQNDVVLVLSDDVGFDESGYHVRLSTLDTENGDVRSITPIVTAYKNNQVISYDEIRWTSENSDVVMVTGNRFFALKEGKTTVVGECTVEGVVYSVPVSVDVYRPKIMLDEHFLVEIENVTDLEIASAVTSSTPCAVVYEGVTVGQYNGATKKITLEKDNFPKASALLGENRLLSIETNVASYVLNVDVYTKIIKTKADFEGFAALAKEANEHAAIWDGYFVLGADIAYNGLFKSKLADQDSLYAAIGDDWSNGGLYGFKGVFDGKDHVIEGVSIDNGKNTASIFGVLHIEGVVKNVSFTKANVAANASLVCSAGGGTVKNVYIQYDSMGKGTQHYEGDGITVNNYCASFFGFKEPTVTANVSNCVIDVTNTAFEAKTAIKIVGSEHVARKDVFVIGGTKELQNSANATLTFASNVDFMDSKDAQTRYANFSSDFWSKEQGVPISKAVYDKVCAKDVQVLEEITHLAAGTSYALSLNNDYTRIVCNVEGVSVKGNVLTVSQTATPQTVVITATSVFDGTKSASFNCAIIALDMAQSEDLTAEESVFYDLTDGKVYLAELGEKVEDKILYYTNLDGSVATYAKDGETGALLAVSERKFYKLNYLSVTKVIDEADDLHYIRRDYTVESYGNKGCYDGLLGGTFVLIDHIDCTGLQLENTGRYWENSRGFNGVFDGRGYTISNLSVSTNGLFGSLTYATIKNVEFKNVKLKAEDQGLYVALFASRAFNTTVENVKIHFGEYIYSESVYHTSGLMFYETTFDCTLKNITLDISDVTGVRYVLESFHGADVPYLSKEKSTCEDMTLIVADLNDVPVYAFNAAKGTDDDVVAYPEGSFTIQDKAGNVKE
ncbi:MAG: hypothetical protein IJ308_06920 [Clostridia bacterium]|nr:hypothetical protein [Clostridia bacterium]